MDRNGSFALTITRFGMHGDVDEHHCINRIHINRAIWRLSPCVINKMMENLTHTQDCKHPRNKD